MQKKKHPLRVNSAWLLLGLPLSAMGCGGEGGSGGESAVPPPSAEPRPSGADAEAPPSGPLANPNAPEMNETAPETFRARFTTSRGTFVVEAHRAWAPRGVDRFYNLVRHGFFDGVRFFRVVEDFMAQFGIQGDPAIQARWRTATIQDDPVVESNTRGRLTFAKTGAPNSRTTQLFINYVDNSNLDAMGFAPIGEVVEGMDVVDALYSGYGEGAPRGTGPDQRGIQARGNAYLEEEFPRLDYIERAEIVEGG